MKQSSKASQEMRIFNTQDVSEDGLLRQSNEENIYMSGAEDVMSYSKNFNGSIEFWGREKQFVSYALQHSSKLSPAQYFTFTHKSITTNVLTFSVHCSRKQVHT